MARFHYVLLVCAILIAFQSSLVAAEGQRDSSISGALTGFNFRDYYDNNWDNTSSWVAMTKCYSTPGYPPAYSWNTQLWHVYRNST